MRFQEFRTMKASQDQRIRYLQSFMSKVVEVKVIEETNLLKRFNMNPIKANLHSNPKLIRAKSQVNLKMTQICIKTFQILQSK